MASLPSFAVGSTPKLEADLRKHSSTSHLTDKSPGVSYQRSHTTTKLEGSSESVRDGFFMIREDTKIESSLYVPILQECIDGKNSVSDAHIAHAHMIKTGAHEDFYLMTFLVNVYGKCGAMGDARKVFDKLPRRNVVTWTALMTGYVHNLQPELALRVFLEMIEAGAYPTNYTLGCVFSACSSLCLAELGEQIHAYAIKYHIEFDRSVGSSICSMYSKCGSLESVVKAFRRVEEKDVISWTAAICACVDNGVAAMGLRFFTEMLSEGVEPNEFTLTGALSSCCMMRAFGVGEQVHSLCVKLGYESNPRITNSIMYLYLKFGLIKDARRLFDQVESASLVAWNTMIAGHAQMMDLAKDDLSAHNSGTEALNIFLKLNQSGIKPDLFTLSSILTICSGLAALEQGEQVHALTIKTGFLSDVVVGTALINMYNKCGSIERANQAFVEMPTRTLVSWTSMITGFAQHGQSQQALQLFEDMRRAGVRPNKITFVGVLSACSHAGMVDEAMSYFEMIKAEYKIKPVMEHFACLIDMFVRLGQLEEAFDFIKKMNFEPNKFIWSILVAGCKSHGKLELGFYAAEQLLKLKLNDTETYLLLLKMYVSAGRWKDVAKVRKMKKEEKLGKLRDWSWIRFKDKVHSFKPDDRSHPHSEKMYELLEDLLNKSKSLGYESLGSIEVTDEDSDEETSSAVYHSEQLAVAFGLLNMPSAVPLRIIKSIAMCKDCHSFIKFVSLLTSREIIIRDSKRLHKFINGPCSCGDFGSLL
ncbi:pentatricopeptide repeat-containing protein At3g24000, mitochondrial-like [Malania oleifera]|uniref:pentatricopeptide repeat-containing protein At3g24000, mitochondrial-like n=1 Tax=Malania oleifera TaxID=397392 RepID=UPI0025ADC4BF|nr:pentatricopeptide repeat-containing protein At3g24000, mitochondrial-like [Malania oleifera]XP_057974212.1 pentatricopeptide repeat-containing protein At3g24000, mitochondrial-like [Malania oleifera]